MSTYIVEIDSTYRDINQYQNQCDFGVSFQQNTTTDYQIQGYPLSFTGTNNLTNFFLQSSIDPDYIDSNLKIYNGTIQQINRSLVNKTQFYISGIAFDTTSYLSSSTGFAIRYKNTLLTSLTGINNTSPYLCRLDEQVDGTYTLNWIIYAIGNLSTGTTGSTGPLAGNVPRPTSINSKHTLSEKQGLFWFWDLNFDYFFVYLKKNVSTTILFSLSNFSFLPSEYNNIVFAFDTEGSPYFINNRPWGYHLLQSDFKLLSVVDKSNMTIQADRADNLYLTTNTDSTDCYFGSVNINLKVTPAQSLTVNAFIAYRMIGGVLYEFYVTDTDSYYFGSGFLSSFITVMRSTPEGLTMTNPYAFNIASFFSPTPAFIKVSIQNYYTEVSGRLFFFTVPSQTPDVWNAVNVYGLYVFEIDLVAGTFTNVAVSSNLFNRCSIVGTTIGTKVYIGARSNNFTIYMFEFDTTTNTLTQKASLGIATVVTASASVSTVQTDADTIMICSPDNDTFILTPGATITTRSETVWFLKYTISTATLTLVKSSDKIYPSCIGQRILAYKNNRILLFIGGIFPSIISVYDVTDANNPFFIRELSLSKQAWEGAFSVYSYVDKFGTTHYMLSVSQSGGTTSLFCIDDLINVIPISTNLTVNRYGGLDLTGKGGPTSMGPGYTSYGYTYGNSLGAFVNKYRWCSYPNAKIYSSHYYYNLQSLYNLTNNIQYFAMKTLDYNGNKYVFVASGTGLDRYLITGLFEPSFLNTLSFQTSMPFPANPIYFDYLLFNTTQLYFYVANNLEVQIYLTDVNFTSWTYVGSVAKTVNDIRGVVIYYSQNAISPGYYIVVGERFGLLRKYQLTGSTLSGLISSASIPLGSQVGFNREMTFLHSIVYYQATNQYITYLCGQAYSGVAPVGAQRMFPINVTEPSQLVLVVAQAGGPASSTDITTWTQEYSAYGKTSIRNLFAEYSGGLLPSSSYLGTTDDYNQATSPFRKGIFYYGPNYSQSFGSPAGFQYVVTTTWFDKLTQKTYMAFNNNGQTGVNDYITIMDVTNVMSVTEQIGSSSLSVPGNVLQLSNIQDGLRTVLVALIKPVSTGPTGGYFYTGSVGSYTGPNSLWIYDVSNVTNAALYQTTTKVTNIYSNVQAGCGGGVIHKVSALGVPEWLDIVGGSLDNVSTYNNIYINDSVQDPISSTLYVSGQWSRGVQFFDNNLTGAVYSLRDYPVNEFLVSNGSNQAFIARLSLIDGRWEFAEALVGDGESIISSIGYTQSTKQLLSSCYFSSINLSLYRPQFSLTNPTGTYSFTTLGVPQEYFYNSAATNSVLFSLDNNGSYQWRNILYSTENTSSTNLYKLYIDENTPSDIRILTVGNTSATRLIGTSQITQALYPNIDPINQQASILYQFSLSGAYLGSSYQAMPPNNVVTNALVIGFSDTNNLWTFNQSNFNSLSTGTKAYFYNRDSTLADNITMIPKTPNTFVSNYQYNSIYQDPNGFSYSTVVLYNFTGSLTGVSQSFVKSSLFLFGDPDDSVINQNFSIRQSTFDPSTGITRVILNQQVSVNQIIRRFLTINGITGSNQYYSSNLSYSQLFGVGNYLNTGSIIGNTITFSTIYNQSPGSIDETKEYFIVIPQCTGPTGTYNDIIPITSFTYNSSTEKYTVSVDDINDLRVCSPSGPIYGPYLYICEKNYSSFYSLQWYPGSRVYPQTYLVGLYDLILPNRPVQNSRYPGLQSITKYPYIYVVLYNADDDDNFDPTVVNSVYDNNIDAPRFAIFQIPTTTFAPFSSSIDYVSATSSATPKIRFVPGFYKLRCKITDDRGNPIIFDNTPYKEGDSLFLGSVVPESLLNVTVRLAFKRS